MDEVLLRFESMFETVVCKKNCTVEGKVMKGITKRRKQSGADDKKTVMSL